MKFKNMPMKQISYLWLVIVAVVSAVAFTDDQHKNGWIEPDMWSKELNTRSHSSVDGECTSCNECFKIHQVQPMVENNATKMYFKRFIRLLFNRKNMNYDSLCNRYDLNVRIFVTDKQLEYLEKADDPRSVDGLITEIFENAYKSLSRSNTVYEQPGLKADLYNIWNDFWALFKTSEVRFVLIFLCITLSTRILARGWNVNYFILLCAMLFIFGYLHTYLECNRELEVNETIEKMQEREKLKWTFFGYIKSFFVNVDDDTISQLKKSSKIKLGFCRPDDVLLTYMNNAVFKYIRSLITEYTSCAIILTNKLPFPFNLFAVPMLTAFVIYILKLLFAHVISPSNWLGLWYLSYHKTPTIQNHTFHNTEDKVSGENLKSLLNVIKTHQEIIKKEDIKNIENILNSKNEEFKKLAHSTNTSLESTPSIPTEQLSGTINECNEICVNKETTDTADATKVPVKNVLDTKLI